MKLSALFTLLGLVLLAACSPSAGSGEPAAVPATTVVAPSLAGTNTAPPTVVFAATDAPPPTATEPAATETAFATAAPTPSATADADTPAVAEASVAYGRTADGAFFHGAADAPVTLIDYSDFL